MPKIELLKTSIKKLFCFLLCVSLSIYFIPSLSVRVYASSGDAVKDYTIGALEDFGLKVTNSTVSYFTSVDPATLEICEKAVAFGYAVGQDLQYAIEHSEDLPSNVGSSSVSVGQCIWTDSDGVTHNAIGSVKANDNSISFMCLAAGAYCIDAFSSYSHQARTTVDVQSARIRFGILMGKTWEGYSFVSSYFDSGGSDDTHGSDYKNFNIPVKRSSGPHTLTPTSFGVNSFGLYSNGLEYLAVRSGQAPIDVSPDYSSPEALYQSSQAYYNGLLENFDKDLVDQFWFDFPDPAQEETTEPNGSGCCCEPFTLPPEWVQSDVVELETDHYTVPYKDLIEDPYAYIRGEGVGVTAMPVPPTPEPQGIKRLQTQTVARGVDTSQDPAQDLKALDPMMYEAIHDYSVLITDIMDQSGVLPYWAILIGAGALFLFI